MVNEFNFPAFAIIKKKIMANTALKDIFKQHPELKAYIKENINEIILNDKLKFSSDTTVFDIIKAYINRNEFYIVNAPSATSLPMGKYSYDSIFDLIMDLSLSLFQPESVSIFKYGHGKLVMKSLAGKNVFKKNDVIIDIKSFPHVEELIQKRIQVTPPKKTLKRLIKDTFLDYNYTFIPLYEKSFFYGMLIFAGKSDYSSEKDKIYNLSDFFGKLIFNEEQSNILQILRTLQKELFTESYLFDNLGHVLFPIEKRNEHFKNLNLNLQKFPELKKILEKTNPYIVPGENKTFYVISKRIHNDSAYYFIGKQNINSDYFNYGIDLNYQSVLSNFFADASFGLFVQVGNKITFYNKQFLDMFPSFLTYKDSDFFSFIPNVNEEKRATYHQELQNIGHLNIRIDIFKNNSFNVYNAFLSQFKNNFGIHITGIIVDITNVATYEKEIIELKKRETLQNLSSIIGNQINNLLQPIVGYASYLKMIAGDDSEIKDVVSKIEQSTTMATDLIRRVPIKIKKPGEIVDLYEECKNIIEIIDLIKPDNIKIYYTGEENNYCSLISSMDYNQIMLNIIYNALEALQNEGTIEINFGAIHIAEKEKIRIYGLKNRDFIHINIKDNGAGIPKDIMQQIFKPFFTTKESGHSGLGLSMVLEILENNNGFIEILSKKGVGTDVNIYLPQYPCENEEPPLTAKENMALNVKEMLIMEDNSIVSSFMDSILNEFHIRHYIAENTEEGINYLKEHKESITHIYIDFNLRGMPVVELYKKLHSIAGDVHYIVSSGYFAPDKLQALLRLNNDIMILKKPFDYNAFLKAIQFE